VREPDHLLGRDLARIDGDVDPAALVDADGQLVVRERDREPHAVRLREDRPVEVARVVVEAEDGGRGASDPLAFEELRIEGVSVEAPHPGQRLGDVADALALGIDEPHADVELEQRAGDRRAHATRAEDDDVIHALVGARDGAAPRPRRGRRPDHHHPVARQDHLVTAGKDHAVAAHQSRDLRVGRDPRVAQRTTDQAVVRRFGGHVELDDLDLAVGEDVRVARGRQTEDRGDRIRRLQFGRDHEVDFELTLAPRLEVRRAGGADDRLGVRHALEEHRADEVRLFPRAAPDEEVAAFSGRPLDDALGCAVALDRPDVEPPSGSGSSA
jgi:hypothetical protein